MNKKFCVVDITTKDKLKKVLQKAKKLGYKKILKEIDKVWKIAGKKIVIFFESDRIIEWNKGCDNYPNYRKLTYNNFMANKKPKSPKYLVVWEEEDEGDPMEEFTTLAEAKKKVEELFKNEYAVNSSIIVYEIKRIAEPRVEIVFNTDK